MKQQSSREKDETEQTISDSLKNVLTPTASVVACHSDLPHDSDWYNAAHFVADVLGVLPIAPSASSSSKDNIHQASDVVIKVKIRSVAGLKELTTTPPFEIIKWFDNADTISSMDLSSIGLHLDVANLFQISQIPVLGSQRENIMRNEVDVQAMRKLFSNENGLQKITLDNNAIGGRAGANLLMQCLSNTSVLTRLSLQGCSFQEGFLPTFVCGVCNNTSLIELDMSRTCLGGNKAATMAFDKLFREQHSVTFLNLSKNNFNKQDAEMVSGLGTTTHLKWLDLSNNDLCSAAIVSLTSFLKENKSIEGDHFFMCFCVRIVSC
jgi:Leucine-rich repeat (LRR) protein